MHILIGWMKHIYPFRKRVNIFERFYTSEILIQPFLCMSCFVWKSNHIKVKSLQWSCCSNYLDLTVESRRHQSMADRRIYLVRKGTWPELLFLLAEPMLSHVLTFLQGEFKYPSWHGFKARHQQLASQWSGEPAVMTKNSAKSFRVVKGSLIPAN